MIYPVSGPRGWPGLRYSEAPARHPGASEYLSPGHPCYISKGDSLGIPT